MSQLWHKPRNPKPTALLLLWPACVRIYPRCRSPLRPRPLHVVVQYVKTVWIGQHCLLYITPSHISCNSSQILLTSITQVYGTPSFNPRKWFFARSKRCNPTCWIWLYRHRCQFNISDVTLQKQVSISHIGCDFTDIIHTPCILQILMSSFSVMDGHLEDQSNKEKWHYYELKIQGKDLFGTIPCVMCVWKAQNHRAVSPNPAHGNP